MTMTARPTLADVLFLARRLRPADQARLVAQLTPMIASALEGGGTLLSSPDDPWERLAQLREEFREQGPVTPSVTDELLASRR